MPGVGRVIVESCRDHNLFFCHETIGEQLRVANLKIDPHLGAAVAGGHIDPARDRPVENEFAAVSYRIDQWLVADGAQRRRS